MIFQQIKSGGNKNFAYLIAGRHTAKGALVDPAPDPRRVLNAIKHRNLEIAWIINTHSHSDHAGGNDYFRKEGKNNQPVFINCPKGQKIRDGQVIDIGGVSLELIATPGHTPDSICIKAGDKLMTGDTLFVGKIGGTWTPEDAKMQWESLQKIASLPPHIEVWPGHDCGIKPNSTIGYEIQENPFFHRLSSYHEFLWLKQNWAQYKREHGIQ